MTRNIIKYQINDRSFLLPMIGLRKQIQSSTLLEIHMPGVHVPTSLDSCNNSHIKLK